MTTPEPNSDDGGPVDSLKEEARTAFSHDAPPPLPAPAWITSPSSHREPGPGVSAALGWAAIGGVVLALGAAGWLAFDLERAGSTAFWVYAIAPTAAVAVVALVRAARDGELGDLVRPEWGDATRAILSAALLLGGTVGFLRVVAPAGSPRESWMARVYLQLGDTGWLRGHAGLVALMVLAAAAAEEIVWRGLVTRLIAERVGSRSAWIWAAVAYAMAQIPTAWVLRDPEAGLNPLLIVGALALGLVWGAMARWTRRLMPSILSHAAFDWCVIMLFRLWGSGV